MLQGLSATRMQDFREGMGQDDGAKEAVQSSIRQRKPDRKGPTLVATDGRKQR